MDTMISVDEAFEHYDQAIKPLPTQVLPVKDALRRVTSEDARALTDLPPFDQSAMDGYALRAEETRHASAENPARLKLVGEIPAGRLPEIPKLRSGEAMRIFTGGYVPEGADAVLMPEEAQVQDEELLVSRPLGDGENVRKHGEEIEQDAVLVRTGTRLGPGHLGALSIAGVSDVKVYRKPSITLFITGDEIVKPGRVLRAGEVYDANRPLVAGWLNALGYAQIETAHLPDSLEGTEQALQRALERSNLILTTGGVSVGERDFVISAAENIGVEAVFWKVKQKPGKPLFFGMLDEKILLGLPGNPGSVFACLVTHGRRVLDLLEGVSQPGPRFYPGRWSGEVELSPQREWWARCRLDVSPEGEVWLEPFPRQGSHMITNLGECDALARVPMGEGVLERGSRVEWTPGIGADLRH